MSNQGNHLPEGWGEIRSISKDPNQLLDQVLAHHFQKVTESKQSKDKENQKR